MIRVEPLTLLRSYLRTARHARQIGLVSLCLALLGCGAPDPNVVELTGSTMGTSYSIKLAAPQGPAGLGLLHQQIEALLSDINRQMSTYIPDSDLSRFNRSQSTEWQSVPSALVDLVEQARRVSDDSDGMYDITVGPLVELWGFGPGATGNTPPGAHEIAAVLPSIGYRKLYSRHTPPALRKTVADLQADLSSIAKGWAVDRLADLLIDAGYTSFLVEIGGEVYAQGQKRSGHAWRIAIEQPLYDHRAVHRVIELNDMALATSGDYRNYFSTDGQRYSHTIDPGSGHAVQHSLAAVTVLADNCTTADAWATALMALGSTRGLAVAESQQIMALFLIRNNRGFEERTSPALARLPAWRIASAEDPG